jgi:ATP-dependent Clp protease adaptor protein ClpS
MNSLFPSPSSFSSESPSMSTVIKPRKKTSKTIREAPEEPTIIPGIFKESRNILKEFEEYVEERSENFILLLFNDPYNKRIYVATCLMQILSFTEEVAADVMMQAHTNGFAVVGEWTKEIADDYCKQLVEKGLLAEVVKTPGDGDGDEGGGSE